MTLARRAEHRLAGIWPGMMAAIAIVTVGLGASYFIDRRVEGLLRKDTFQALANEQATLMDVYQDEGISGLGRTLTRLTRANRQNSAIYYLREKNGKILAANFVDALPITTLVEGRSEFELETKDGPTVLVDALTKALPNGSILLIGRTSDEKRLLQSALKEAILITLAAVGLSALGLALVLERILRHRVDVIADTAATISSGDLSRRVPLAGRSDEFDRLADVINVMLEQLEAQVITMRTVSNSLAHDMRLPLTRIRAGLEAAALATNEKERQAALDRSLLGTDVALSTFNTLLEIARAESGVGKDAFDFVDLPKLVSDVAEVFAPLAEDKHQTLQINCPERFSSMGQHIDAKNKIAINKLSNKSGPIDPVSAVAPDPLQFWGQGVLLRQGLGNVLHNAIKYSREGSNISVSLALASAVPNGAFVDITIADDGLGIAQDQRERALLPFGRLDRDGTIDGTGLGLALASSIARLHGGELILADNQPGLMVVFRLPLASAKVLPAA